MDNFNLNYSEPGSPAVPQKPVVSGEAAESEEAEIHAGGVQLPKAAMEDEMRPMGEGTETPLTEANTELTDIVEADVANVEATALAISQTVLSSEQKITLQVGTRRFVTTADTLKNSNYFRALLRGPWQPQDDGSFFVDADPDLFQHVLRHLRHGALPLFYDRVRGHDYGLYDALLAEADYFGVGELYAYLDEKKYLERVKIRHEVALTEGSMMPVQLGGSVRVNETINSSTEVDYQTSWVKRKIYVCPRGIEVHKGRPRNCGRQCHNARGEDDPQYEEEVRLETVEIKKQIVIN